MKIGVIGTGNMGRTLGPRWASTGHQVLFGSRDLAKAKAVAARASRSGQASVFDEAAAFGDDTVARSQVRRRNSHGTENRLSESRQWCL